MTQDEIIEMAKLAGLEMDDSCVLSPQNLWYIYQEQLETFAKLVAAKEREACANLCDEREKDFMGLFHKYGYEEDSGAMLASMQCAKAIRARVQA